MKPAIAIQTKSFATLRDAFVSTATSPALACMVCLSLALLFPGFAQTTAPAPLPPEAQEAVHKGVLAANQQDYLLATRFFQGARKIAPQASEIYYDLGLAESKIPGRELRAISWFEAYLTATPNAPNAAAVKEQIDVLDVKSQSNLSHLIETVQDAAKKIDNKLYLGDVAGLWAEAGDIAKALKIVDLLPSNTKYKSYAQSEIAQGQSKAGDIAGAQKTTDSIQERFDKASAQQGIAESQAKAGDIAGALKTADLIQYGMVKGYTLSAVAIIQAKAGNVAGAIETADLIDLVPDKFNSEYQKFIAQRAIAEAQAKAGSTTNLASNVSPKALAQVPLQPAIVVMSVGDWLNRLEDNSSSNDCALNTDPFLDLASYLKSLPPSDTPQKAFESLRDTAKTIVTAQNVIDRMLKQQARK